MSSLDHLAIGTFILSSTLAYAHFFTRRANQGVMQVQMPGDFSEFMSREFHDILVYLKRSVDCTPSRKTRSRLYCGDFSSGMICLPSVSLEKLKDERKTTFFI